MRTSSASSACLAIGAGLFVAILALLGAFDADDVRGWNDAEGRASSTASVLALSIASGIVEELIFRDLLFRLVEAWRGRWVAMTTSGMLFGIAHWLSPNATWEGVLAIVVEAGIPLSVADLVTRRSWLSIGVHIA